MWPLVSQIVRPCYKKEGKEKEAPTEGTRWTHANRIREGKTSDCGRGVSDLDIVGGDRTAKGSVRVERKGLGTTRPFRTGSLSTSFEGWQGNRVIRARPRRPAARLRSPPSPAPAPASVRARPTPAPWSDLVPPLIGARPPRAFGRQPRPLPLERPNVTSL